MLTFFPIQVPAIHFSYSTQYWLTLNSRWVTGKIVSQSFVSGYRLLHTIGQMLNHTGIDCSTDLLNGFNGLCLSINIHALEIVDRLGSKSHGCQQTCGVTKKQTLHHALLWRCSVRSTNMQHQPDKRWILAEPQLAVTDLHFTVQDDCHGTLYQPRIPKDQMVLLYWCCGLDQKSITSHHFLLSFDLQQHKVVMLMSWITFV